MGILAHGVVSHFLGGTTTTAVACTSGTEVLEGVLGAVNSQEFVFSRLIALSDGCTLAMFFSFLSPLLLQFLTRFGWVFFFLFFLLGGHAGCR